MQIYLAVTPAQLPEASAYHHTFAHVAYRIGPDSVLLRQNLLLQTRGGLLSISDREAPRIEDPDELCAAVGRECARRGYSGAVLDFEEPQRPDRQAFVTRLDRSLAAARRVLYLPEAYAAAAPQGTVLVCTALSGGNFSDHLRQSAAARGGAQRIALDVQRLCMDFTLPAPSGEGTPLRADALLRLLQSEQPSVFFSQDLCARYFTYAREGTTHFVLFDDAGTLAQKLRIGSALDISAAFLMFPEVRDLLPRLFPPRSS